MFLRACGSRGGALDGGGVVRNLTGEPVCVVTEPFPGSAGHLQAVPGDPAHLPEGAEESQGGQLRLGCLRLRGALSCLCLACVLPACGMGCFQNWRGVNLWAHGFSFWHAVLV